jgi:hypothetical protein
MQQKDYSDIINGSVCEARSQPLDVRDDGKITEIPFPCHCESRICRGTRQSQQLEIIENEGDDLSLIHMKIIVIFMIIILVNCASVKEERGITAREVSQWNEALDLAYPEDVEVKLVLEKLSLLQGEPLLFRSYIINKTDSVITVIPPANRLVGQRVYWLYSDDGIEYGYKAALHGYRILLPGEEKTISPHDSLYINEILWSNNFFRQGRPDQRDEPMLFAPTSAYHLYGRFSLGTKWLPRPPRGLLEYSDTVTFTIHGSDLDQENKLKTLNHLISSFFYEHENILIALHFDSVPETDLSVLNNVRKGASCMAPLADFVWISSHAVLDSLNIEPVIAEAKRFITEYDGSILAEEMEFLVAKILYNKDKTHPDFTDQAQHFIATYPKNIAMFQVKKWLEEVQIELNEDW